MLRRAGMIRRDGGRAPGSDTDHAVLRPGMVVTLEPTICFSERGDIFVSIEDQFLVTESGAEWLTRDAPLDLYV